MKNKSSDTKDMPGPVLAVLPGAAALAGHLVRGVEAAGWQTIDVTELDGATVPALVVGAVADLAEVAAGLNLATGRIAVDGGDAIAAADEALARDADRSAIATLLARWTPQALPDAVQRQRYAFGTAAIDPLLMSLRERLAAALDADPESARAAAHHLAGLAGILGFAELAAAWEGYSADGDSRRADARRLARLALATMGQADLSDSAA